MVVVVMMVVAVTRKVTQERCTNNGTGLLRCDARRIGEVVALMVLLLLHWISQKAESGIAGRKQTKTTASTTTAAKW